MRDFILQTAENVGIFYIIYVATILILNSVMKAIFDVDYQSKTKALVTFTTGILFFCFWLAGGKLRLLFLYTFFSVGFYDFLGRYIEAGVIWAFAKLADLATLLKDYIKSKF